MPSDNDGFSEFIIEDNFPLCNIRLNNFGKKEFLWKEKSIKFVKFLGAKII